jgi:hypothetical protein
MAAVTARGMKPGYGRRNPAVTATTVAHSASSADSGNALGYTCGVTAALFEHHGGAGRRRQDRDRPGQGEGPQPTCRDPDAADLCRRIVQNVHDTAEDYFVDARSGIEPRQEVL